ncbi:MAG: sugar phosphate isomerase/epimerase [Halieaceae bacterium]|jgi:sugar phosphate isomerase/epimerase|nr:sugar phosphate isomerase/epimerase [Halieaceae bacterium]
MKRRELLRLMAQGSALAACPSLAFGANQVPGDFKFGLQLSTLNRLMNEEFFETITLVKAMGYNVVEFSGGGYLGHDPQRVKAHLAELQLSAPVGRVAPNYPPNYRSLSQEERRAVGRSQGGLDDLVSKISAALPIAVDMHQQYLNIPIISEAEFTTRAKVENVVRVLNEAGKLCQEKGVLLGYHNHAFEFANVEGILPYDLMLAETDPDLVSFQLDTYWVTRGGGDIMQYLSDHPGRFPSCHLKDIDAEGKFEDVGSGLIDFPAFITLAMEQGSKHFFVERDGPPNPLQSASNSFNYLTSLS